MARGALRVTASPPNDDAPPAVGRISFVDNAVDPATGTIRIKGTFPNTDRRLWPGQFVNVTVTLTTETNAIVVPSVAVQAGQQGPFVFVVKPDQTVELRNVVVDAHGGGRDRDRERARARRDGRHRRPSASGARKPHLGQGPGRPRHAAIRGLRDPMNLSSIFIRRPVTTTLLMLGILVFGTLAYQELPVADLPSVDFPTHPRVRRRCPAPARRRWPRRWRFRSRSSSRPSRA